LRRSAAIGLAHPRVLHLHRDRALLAGGGVDHDGAVHLADAGGGERLRVPLDEQLRRARAELALDHLGAASSALIGGAFDCSWAKRFAQGPGRPSST
jgi:hypothetical protein